MTTAVRPLMTADEFLASGEADGYELVNGVPEELHVGAESGWIVTEVAGQIRDHLKENPIAILFSAETPIAIWPDNQRHFRKPDAFTIRRGKLPGDRLPSGMLYTVPDLIVEVISPGDVAEVLEEKLEDYRRARVPLVWVIYPHRRYAYVHRPDRDPQLVRDVLDGEDALPGFRLDLRALFEAADRAAQPEPSLLERKPAPLSQEG